jgi:hypothetical protein
MIYGECESVINCICMTIDTPGTVSGAVTREREDGFGGGVSKICGTAGLAITLVGDAIYCGNGERCSGCQLTAVYTSPQ